MVYTENNYTNVRGLFLFSPILERPMNYCCSISAPFKYGLPLGLHQPWSRLLE